MGKATARDDGLLLQADPAGQILLEFSPQALALGENTRVELEFAGTPPLQVYLFWRNSIDQRQLRQFRYLPGDKTSALIDMSAHPHWQGEARVLQLGFRGPPDQNIHFLSMAIHPPGIMDHLQELWQNWGAFRGWKPADINVYTGTREFNTGPYPTPVFAALVLAALLAYLLVKRAKASWQGAALVLFCGWLALDSLWQIRLWQQVALTRATFAGAGQAEKLERAGQAAISTLAREARKRISDPRARVFVATRSDSTGMHAAYYLAPLNVYWHRHGPELPELEALPTGSFIMLLRPSALRLDREKQLLLDRQGGQLPIAIHLQDKKGLLLEVRP